MEATERDGEATARDGVCASGLHLAERGEGAPEGIHFGRPVHKLVELITAIQLKFLTTSAQKTWRKELCATKKVAERSTMTLCLYDVNKLHEVMPLASICSFVCTYRMKIAGATSSFQKARLNRHDKFQRLDA